MAVKRKLLFIIFLLGQDYFDYPASLLPPTLTALSAVSYIKESIFSALSLLGKNMHFNSNWNLFDIYRI
jgi:hypothetical protein